MRMDVCTRRLFGKSSASAQWDIPTRFANGQLSAIGERRRSEWPRYVDVDRRRLSSYINLSASVRASSIDLPLSELQW